MKTSLSFFPGKRHVFFQPTVANTRCVTNAYFAILLSAFPQNIYALLSPSLSLSLASLAVSFALSLSLCLSLSYLPSLSCASIGVLLWDSSDSSVHSTSVLCAHSCNVRLTLALNSRGETPENGIFKLRISRVRREIRAIFASPIKIQPHRIAATRQRSTVPTCWQVTPRFTYSLSPRADSAPR